MVNISSPEINTTRAEEPFERRSWLISVIATVLLPIILCLSVFGNILVCAIIFNVRKLRKKSSILIINLAVGDFGNAAFNVPISLAALTKYEMGFGRIICDFNGILLVVFVSANLLTVTSIAVYRYIQICHSSTYMRHISLNWVIGEYAIFNFETPMSVKSREGRFLRHLILNMRISNSVGTFL